MNILETLPKPIFILAPMDDVTDSVFRQIVAACAKPDLYVTEFVNVDGLQSPGRPKLLKKLQFSSKETPILAQFWGLKPENFYKCAQEAAKMGFDGVDLNMGCPVKTVIKNGACAALIKNRALASEIIEAAREGAGSLPISVKTRVGFNHVDMDWLEFLLTKKLNMLSIHGRTAKQLSNVPANWDLIAQARKMRDSLAAKTLIFGNGNVKNRAHGLELIKKHRLDGVMIGRGIFDDPFAFALESPWPNYRKQQKIDLYKEHIRLFAKTWTKGEYKFESLRKFAKVYLSNFDGAAELRAEFMTSHTPAEALKVLNTA